MRFARIKLSYPPFPILNTTDGQPFDVVDLRKQENITRLALAWLKKHGRLERPSRFEFVSILGPDERGEPQIQHFRTTASPLAHPSRRKVSLGVQDEGARHLLTNKRDLLRWPTPPNSSSIYRSMKPVRAGHGQFSASVCPTGAKFLARNDSQSEQDVGENYIAPSDFTGTCIRVRVKQTSTKASYNHAYLVSTF